MPRYRCSLLLLTLLLPACSSSDPAADAAPVGADAEPLCDSSHPGVRVHLNVTFEPGAGCFSAGDRQALGLGTTGANGVQLSRRFAYSLGGQAAPFTVTTTLGYPEGTVAGPASVGFYAIHGPLNWEGVATFTADPDACVEVDLPIRCYMIGSPDAGASDAGP
jgi:hypothetical protein